MNVVFLHLKRAGGEYNWSCALSIEADNEQRCLRRCRKSGQIHLSSPGALKVVKRWAGVQDSNDRSVDALKTWKTTENKETESPNKAQRKLRTNYVLIDFVVGYYLCAEIPVFT